MVSMHVGDEHTLDAFLRDVPAADILDGLGAHVHEIPPVFDLDQVAGTAAVALRYAMAGPEHCDLHSAAFSTA